MARRWTLIQKFKYKFWLSAYASSQGLHSSSGESIKVQHATGSRASSDVWTVSTSLSGTTRIYQAHGGDTGTWWQFIRCEGQWPSLGLKGSKVKLLVHFWWKTHLSMCQVTSQWMFGGLEMKIEKAKEINEWLPQDMMSSCDQPTEVFCQPCFSSGTPEDLDVWTDKQTLENCI